VKDTREINESPEKEVVKTPEKKIDTFDDLRASDKPDRIDTFDDIRKQGSDRPAKTFDDFRREKEAELKMLKDTDKKFESSKKYQNEKQVNEILEKTDPHWKETDKLTDPDITKKEFEKRGDWRREFSSDAGKEEHKKWKEEIIERETKAGRIEKVDYDLEPTLTHPDGGRVYPDYVDYKKDIIIDRKPIGEGESKESLEEKYAEQRQRHIDAYEHSTGRKVLHYDYDLYPSPKDIY